MSGAELPRRKPNRLNGYDYSQNGAYFVTICTRDRKNLFWRENVGADSIRPKTPVSELLSEYGSIVERAILAIPEHYSGVAVDQYVIMPNHIHLILRISEPDSGCGRILSAPTLSIVVGQMKRHTAKQIGHPVWQKSFYDHVIRNETDYREIWDYIENNPRKWAEDRFYTE